jgi:hypothetical protein
VAGAVVGDSNKCPSPDAAGTKAMVATVNLSSKFQVATSKWARDIQWQETEVDGNTTLRSQFDFHSTKFLV